MEPFEHGSFLGGAFFGALISIAAKIFFTSVLIDSCPIHLEWELVDFTEAIPGALVGGCILWAEKAIIGVIAGATAAMFGCLFGNFIIALVVGVMAGAYFCPR